MSTFVNKILREVEDSSDDFFQTKHLNKRRKDYNIELKRREKEALFNLAKGLKEIKIAYKDKNWKNYKEKLFLELFSELHVADNIDQNRYGYFLLDSNNIKKCFYDLKNNIFWIDYESIWKTFETRFNMLYVDIQTFMKNMSEEYFKLHDATPQFSITSSNKS